MSLLPGIALLLGRCLWLDAQCRRAGRRLLTSALNANGATFQLAGPCPANVLDSATVPPTARNACGAVCAINLRGELKIAAPEIYA